MNTKNLIAGLALFGLAGCGVSEVDAIRTANPSGEGFNQALAREYQELALFEADEMYDWVSAPRYARKGLAAAEGQQVQPFELGAFKLPADKVDELTTARSDLLAVLDASARTKVPAAAGDAQGKFDCWVEQQEENHQPDHIAACRDAFYAAMGIIKAEMSPEQPAPAATAPAKFFTVYFEFDSTEIDETAQNVLIDAIAAARHYGSPVTIVGHTDTSGSKSYNQGLSNKRAAVVKAALEQAQIPDTKIDAKGVGQNDLARQTPDGVRERLNRRVTIRIQ